MRLIDADALLDAIEPMYIAKKDIVPDNLAEGCVQMEKLIKQQPTAYDIDKVIEEIKAKSMMFVDPWVSYEFQRWAIDIVKRGGVGDEQYLHIARGNGKSGLCYADLTDQFEKGVE